MFEKARSNGTLFAIDISTRLANKDRTRQVLSIALQKRAS
jgi:hypothetical protein